MHHHGDPVDGEGEGNEAVLRDLLRGQGAPGIADLHQALADLLDADAGAAPGHGDPQLRDLRS